MIVRERKTNSIGREGERDRALREIIQVNKELAIFFWVGCHKERKREIIGF